MHEKDAKSWHTGVNTILTELNLNETNCNQAKFSLQNVYKNNKLENESLFRKGKLRTFYSSKPIVQKEVYLDILNNRSHQQTLTQLRIGAHKLGIENGRYSKEPIDDRIIKIRNEIL